MNPLAIALVSAACLAVTAVKTAAAPSSQPDAKPMLKQVDLFDGEVGGHFLYRIPGVVITAKGTILAYCEGRRNSRADYGEIETMLRRSTDGGETWSPPEVIAHKGPRIEGNPSKPVGGEHEQTVDNPAAIADSDGSVHFLYCVNYEHAFYMRSDDDGATFSAPVEITSAFEQFRSRCDWNVIAIGPGHGIQLKSGKLLMPVWLSYGPRGHHGPSVAATIYSDDHGKTWNAGDIVLPNEGDFGSPNESMVAQLSDGSVMFNGRSNSLASRRLVATSPDGISHWSKPHFDEALWEPVCAAGLIAMPSEPGTLIFSNPRSLKVDNEGKIVPGGTAKRRNLTIQLSRNDGKTWSASRVLEGGSAGYSDLAATKDGTIFCYYERDTRLTMARFNIAWILAAPKDE